MNNISYKLFTKQDIRNHEVIPNTDAGHAIDKNKINWEIKLYIKDKAPGSDKFILLKNENPYTEEYEFYTKYMPKIFDNTLVPAPLYLDGLDCYAVVEASVSN
jgi:hypothetical protein